MRLTELEVQIVSVRELEARAKARAIADGVIADAIDSLLATCSRFLCCVGPVVVDGDAHFPEAWQGAAILFEGGLDVRGAVDDMDHPGFVVIGGDLSASTLTVTTDWLVCGSIRLAVGLAGTSRGPRLLACEGALESPAIALDDGYSLEVGGVDAEQYRRLVDGRDEKFFRHRHPRSLHQYARAIEDHRRALERSSAFFAGPQADFSAAWEACRDPADLVRAFGRLGHLVSAAGEEIPRGSALLRASQEVLRQLFPLAEGEVIQGESLIEAWLTRGWSDDDAREAWAVGGPAPAERTARTIREYAARRLVGACRCFDRAVKTWYREEAEEDSHLGVLYIVDAIAHVALDEAHRKGCEEILRARLSCPALVESQPSTPKATPTT